MGDKETIPVTSFHFNYNQRENILIISFHRCLLGTRREVETFITQMRTFFQFLRVKCYTLVDLQELYIKPEVGEYFWGEFKRLTDSYTIRLLGYGGPVLDSAVGAKLGTKYYLFPVFYGLKERALALLKATGGNDEPTIEIID
jgi:hypothetical protein